MHLKGARLRLNKVENDIDLDNLDININNAFLLRSHSKTLKR